MTIATTWHHCPRGDGERDGRSLTYYAFPGVPMDFLNAPMRAAWGFIRNQDDRFGVKVVSEETISLVWQVDEEFYPLAANFKRLKGLGFETLEELRRFVDLLPALVEVTGHDLDTISTLINGAEPPLAGPLPMDPPTLKRIARAWMDDMHDYCNVHGWYLRLRTPNIGADYLGGPVVLNDSSGVMFTRER